VDLKFSIEIEREDDGRWIADVTDLPGVMTYGSTKHEAVQRAAALVLRVLADRVEHEETSTPITPFSLSLYLPQAS
jgi:predicted RNase H-like HicB family nuclease